MTPPFCARLLRASVCFAALVLIPALDTSVPFLWRLPSAAADTNDPAEKAFEAAKGLGTVDAWEAFLKSYPSGFHADLARAYIKKLGEGAPVLRPLLAPPRRTNFRLARALGAASYATVPGRITASSTA